MQSSLKTTAIVKTALSIQPQPPFPNLSKIEAIETINETYLESVRQGSLNEMLFSLENGADIFYRRYHNWSKGVRGGYTDAFCELVARNDIFTLSWLMKQVYYLLRNKPTQSEERSLYFKNLDKFKDLLKDDALILQATRVLQAELSKKACSVYSVSHSIDMLNYLFSIIEKVNSSNIQSLNVSFDEDYYQRRAYKLYYFFGYYGINCPTSRYDLDRRFDPVVNTQLSFAIYTRGCIDYRNDYKVLADDKNIFNQPKEMSVKDVKWVFKKAEDFVGKINSTQLAVFNAIKSKETVASMQKIINVDPKLFFDIAINYTTLCMAIRKNDIDAIKWMLEQAKQQSPKFLKSLLYDHNISLLQIAVEGDYEDRRRCYFGPLRVSKWYDIAKLLVDYADKNPAQKIDASLWRNVCREYKSSEPMAKLLQITDEDKNAVLKRDREIQQEWDIYYRAQAQLQRAAEQRALAEARARHYSSSQSSDDYCAEGWRVAPGGYRNNRTNEFRNMYHAPGPDKSFASTIGGFFGLK